MSGNQNNAWPEPTLSAFGESHPADSFQSVAQSRQYDLPISQTHRLEVPTDDAVQLDLADSLEALISSPGDPRSLVGTPGSRHVPFYPEVVQPYHGPRDCLSRADLEEDELVQGSSSLHPLMGTVFSFTDRFCEAPTRPSEAKTGMRFFIPGTHNRLADEWIEILETTPDKYYDCAPEDVREAYKNRCGQPKTSFKGILEEQAKAPEMIVYTAPKLPFTDRFHTTVDLTAASPVTPPPQRSARKRKLYYTSEEEDTDAGERALNSPKRKKRIVPTKPLLKSAPKPTQPDAIDNWMAEFPNRASGRYGGRGNKNVAWSRGHIQAYVELLKVPFEELPDDANSEFFHEMKSVATPKSVDPTLLTMVTTAEELMAFLPYSTVNYEVCERLHRSWKPKEIADYMHHVRNLQYPGSYQRTMFSHQYKPDNVSESHKISNVPSNMSRKSALDRERKKPLHDYYLWWMGEGVINYPTGKAAQLLTLVIHHVRTVTNDRKIKLSQVQEYANKHGIRVPTQDVVKPTTDSVDEDIPSDAFKTQIDNEFYQKFGKHSTAV